MAVRHPCAGKRASLPAMVVRDVPAKLLYGAVGPDPDGAYRETLSERPQQREESASVVAQAQAQAIGNLGPTQVTEPPRLFGRFFVDPDIVSASNQQAALATSVGVTDQEMPASDQEMTASRRQAQARSVPQQAIVAQALGAGGAPVPPAPFTPCTLSRRYRQLPQVRSSRFAGSMLGAQRCCPVRRSSACSSLMWAATRVLVMCKRSVWTALGPTSRTTLIQRIPRQLCLA